MTERILIVGTGLIGGSIGLAVRRAGAAHVIGSDATSSNAELALDAGALDEVAADPIRAASEVDLVVVATPVGQILPTVEAIGTAARPGTVFTDVGSTKASIVDAAEELLGAARPFVGGHPMAGSEGEGVGAARDDLFDGALWILTPTDRTDSDAYRRVNAFVAKLGAHALALHPAEHDALVARVSHLPYAIATSLMVMVGEGGDPRVFRAAAGSFRDMTRTAGTNPTIWRDILSTNADAVEHELDRLIVRLEDFRDALAARDHAAIDALIGSAREARRSFPLKGERTPTEPQTIEVHLADRAGVLAEITTAIGEGGINIEDLWMDHTPAGGVLKMILDGRPNAEKAIALLDVRGFRATMLEER